MLSQEVFLECYQCANQCCGYKDTIPIPLQKAMYRSVKEQFDDISFQDITSIIISEVKCYGTWLSMEEWTSRIDYKYKNKTEVEKVYIYFSKTKTEGSLLYLLSTMNERPYDKGVDEVIKQEPIIKSLLDDFKNDMTDNLFNKYNNPMLEDKRKTEQVDIKQLDFKLKKI